MKIILLGLILIGTFHSGSIVFAQKPKFERSVEGIKEYSLDNGLQVLLLPDQSQSNMVVNIVYHVGSKHEGYGEKGMAHLLEHMLFKSTKNLGDIKKMLSDKGGQANGTTWYDRTNYYEIFPYSDESLRWSIEMEADRMINATILQEDLDKEFSVVRNEFEIGENDPVGTLMERVINAGYLWHNYGNSTIGSKEDIERVKTPQLRRFYEKYYQPDNAVLIIGGKFEEAKALEYIEKYFGTIPRPDRKLDEIITVEPVQDGERFVEIKRAGDSKNIGIMYHTAPFADKDYAALDAVGYILTNNPSGYLYKSLVETKKIASVWQYQPQVRDASFMYFGFDVPNDKNLEETTKAVRTELDKIGNLNFTQEDVNRAKAYLLKNYENAQNNTISTVIRLTEIVGSGDYRLGFLYRDNIENLTLADVNRVAKKYYLANNRTVGVFIPSANETRVKSNEFLASDIKALTENYKGKEVDAEVAPFEASIANLKANYKEGKLSNGVKYGLIDKQIKGNKVNLTIQFPVSNEKDLAGKSSVAQLTAQLLSAGTKNMTKEQIKDQLDVLKSSVFFSFNGQNLVASISTYKDSFEKTMDIVRQIVSEPTFPQNELEKTVIEYTTYYESQLNDPQALAFTEIERLTSNYPKTSLFYTPSYQEEIDGMKKVKQADLVAFYQNVLGANNGVISVIGMDDQKKVESVLEKTFGKWNSKAKFERAYPTYTASKKDDKIIHIADKENAAAVGKINLKINKSNPDYPALVFANEILGSGGFLTARIPMRLREKEGISYGAGSFVNAPTDAKNEVGGWTWYAFLNPTKRGEVENAVKDEIAKIVKSGVTEDEMKSNKTSWNNSRQTNLGSDNYLLSLSQTYLMFGTPFDDFDDLNAKIEKLNVKQVNDALKKYIDPSKMTSVYTGTFEKK